MTRNYPVYRVRDGRRVQPKDLYGTPRFTGPEILHILTWIAGLPGFVVWEHNLFPGGVNHGWHSAKSWHNLMDGDGIGLAGDVNYRPASAEAERLVRDVLPTLRRIGIGYQFAELGHVPNHADHAHVDVGPIGRRGGPAPLYGRFDVRRKADPFAIIKAGPSRPPRPILAYEGMTGLRVRVVQENSGMTGDDVDGKFGPATERAVRNTQRRLGLSADGRFGPQTARGVLARAGTLRRGDRGPAVKLVQFLVSPKANTKAVDGVFGAITEANVEAGQRWARITVDGVFGPASRARLVT